MDLQHQIARALLAIGAVGLSIENPITFKSGIKSPVYVDNRKFPFYPGQWRKVVEGFAALMRDQGLDADVIAGIETAGIPHSAALGFFLEKPSVFVRKEAKDHGTKKRVEGGDVQGKQVLLIEDLVTTGLSSLSGVAALREEGALISDCLIIISYGLPEAEQAFQGADVNLHALTSFPVVLEEAQSLGIYSAAERAVVEAWMKNPRAWGEEK